MVGNTECMLSWFKQRSLWRIFALLGTLAPILCGAMTADEIEAWREDIEVFQSELERRHIDLYHSVSRQAFTLTLNHLDANLGQLSTEQVVTELMRASRRIQDGHTSVPLWDRTLEEFPLRFIAIGDDFYVGETTEAHRHLLGEKLTAINSVPVSELASMLGDITPFTENPFSRRVRVASYLNKPFVLKGLGVITGVQPVVFSFSESQAKLTSAHKVPWAHRLSYHNPALFNERQRLNEHVEFSTLERGCIGYLRMSRYPSMSQMAKFSARVLKEINNGGIVFLVIDLRNNYGGNFFVGLKLAERLVLADGINWADGVFVLTNNVTFSAAMSNAAQFSQLLNAYRVGEPTGARPSGYQDMGQFNLPNSGLLVTYSKRLYRFTDTDSDALYPDQLVELSIDDYRSANDRPLEWVREKITSSYSLSSSRERCVATPIDI